MTKARRYTYSLTFTGKGKGRWQIIDMGSKGYCNIAIDPVVWSMPWRPEHDGLGEPPPEFREKFEEMLRASGWIPTPEPTINIVEMIADGDDCAFDQPCIYGHRVEGHAVYCHNEAWLYAPRKCRRHRERSLIWGEPCEPWPHEDCPGYKPNPNFLSANNSLPKEPRP